jgi:DUF2075 family protein
LKEKEQYLISNYELKLFENIDEMVETIKQMDKKYGLSRLVAGYAWKWNTKKGGDYDININTVASGYIHAKSDKKAELKLLKTFKHVIIVRRCQ